MMQSVLLLLAAVFLAYTNGGNDNFKGVATLYGGKVVSYSTALRWAMITTMAGSLTSLFLASKLLKLFTGQGIVQPSVLADPLFLIVVALSAGIVVLLATFLGFPVSTTHGIVGALAGVGIASGGLTSWAVLGKSFLLPLILGPAIAVVATLFLYKAAHALRVRFGVNSAFCLCVGNTQEALVAAQGIYTIRSSGIRVALQEEQYCRMIYPGEFAGVSLQRIMDAGHFLSAGAVSFARGLNDTPKIAALLLAVSFVSPGGSLLILALAMAVGSIFHSHRVAKRMSLDITEMNPGQALTGNLVTAVLVLLGSLLGMPLSTTHVSCGAIFGIGAGAGKLNRSVVLQILSAWVTTLPMAMAISAALWFLLKPSSY